jgi:beta-phosphoglucomutase-like phosphatase (HAD superfamily)
MPAAVIFDLDGVLIDSEQIWNGVKERLVLETGGQWRDEAPHVMMGMSSPEWAVYLRDRVLIDLALELAGFGDAFRVTVSSEEVERGKPAPDVYLAAANGLGVDPTRCVAIEDSSNGLRAAAAAGMKVIAIPNPHYAPEPDALALAAAAVPVVGDVTPSLIELVAAGS